MYLNASLSSFLTCYENRADEVEEEEPAPEEEVEEEEPAPELLRSLRNLLCLLFRTIFSRFHLIRSRSSELRTDSNSQFDHVSSSLSPVTGLEQIVTAEEQKQEVNEVILSESF